MRLSNPIWVRIGCVALAALMAAILFVGARGIGKVNTVPTAIHKVEHALYYGSMAALLAFALGRRWLWHAVLAASLVGVLDEWHQLYVPGRSGSPYDWLVDTAGAMVGVYVCDRILAAMERRRDEAIATPRT